MREYDDDRYLEWPKEFYALVFEFLDTEGNTEASLETEFEQAVEEARENAS
jgi:hypothetical protein